MKRSAFITFFFVTVAGFLLTSAGCQSTGGLDSPAQKVAAGCLTVAGALDALTVANDHGKLTTSQQNAVLVAKAKTDIICLDDEPPTLDDLRAAAFQAAIDELLRLKGTAQ